MKIDIKDKIVLVTGASSGIGAAISLAFANKGARLALTGRNFVGLKKTQDQILKKGGSAAIFKLDLLEVDQIPNLIIQVEKHFGNTIDILINCAGISVLGTVEKVPVNEYHRVLNINFFAPLVLIQSLIPKMKKKKRGQIINITSGVGDRGLPAVSPYCISKFALNGLTESLRVELAPYNINVINISPGLVSTDFENRINEYGTTEKKFTQGKKSTPEKVAKRILKASIHCKKIVRMSLRTKIGYHLNYWSPRLFDYILKLKK